MRFQKNFPARKGISAEESGAIRVDLVCGNGPGFWLHMQQAYDLWHAEQRLAGKLDKIPAHGPGSAA